MDKKCPKRRRNAREKRERNRLPIFYPSITISFPRLVSSGHVHVHRSFRLVTHRGHASVPFIADSSSKTTVARAERYALLRPGVVRIADRENANTRICSPLRNEANRRPLRFIEMLPYPQLCCNPSLPFLNHTTRSLDRFPYDTRATIEHGWAKEEEEEEEDDDRGHGWSACIIDDPGRGGSDRIS